MTRGDLGRFLVAGFLVAAFLLLSHVAGARAVELPPASPAGTAYAHETAAWVEQATGVPVPRRTVFFVDAFTSPGLEQAEAIVTGPGGDRIEYRRGCRYALETLGLRRGRPWSPYCARATLHEVLHRWDTGSPFPLWARWVEHGLVEAVAEDLWPAFVYQRTGRRDVLSPFTVHGDAVAWVRRASSRATGRPWPSREARVWRRSVWGMDELQRDATFRELGMLCSTCREEPEPSPELLPPTPDRAP